MSTPLMSGQFLLPQHLSTELQRARQSSLEQERARYRWTRDPGLEDAPGAHLPPFLAAWEGASAMRRMLTAMVGFIPPKDIFLTELPPEARFGGQKFFRHGTHAGSMKLRQAYVRLTNLDFKPRSEAAYRRLMGTIPPPEVIRNWTEDEVFARQRLIGVNPMAIRRLHERPAEALRKAADGVLRERHGTHFGPALDAGRLYFTAFPELWLEAAQRHVRPGASLAAPTSLFYAAPDGALHPLAIQLKPQDVREGNPVFTPLQGAWDWRLARAHAQAAESHLHEAVYHLLETHLVTEVVAIAVHRMLHRDHPVRQLLQPHFEYTLAINEQARKNLLADHGEIARCMAAKHTGAVDLARLVYSGWDFDKRSLHADLADRDVHDLPNYWYRDDAMQLWNAMREYSEGVLSTWYHADEDVAADPELAAWCEEVTRQEGGGLAGFPSRLTTRAELYDLVTHVIFRGSAQHAAVNNGQFGAYGWIPNAPVAVYGDLPTEQLTDGEARLSERDFYTCLPDRERTFGQSGMVWLLSEPTERSLLRAGESPAFRREHSPVAYEAVGRFRRRLRSLSDQIDERTRETGISYNYLKPQNIDRSIAI